MFEWVHGQKVSPYYCQSASAATGCLQAVLHSKSILQRKCNILQLKLLWTKWYTVQILSERQHFNRRGISWVRLMCGSVCDPVQLVLTCVSRDLTTSGQLWVHQFTPKIRMCLHMRLQWLLIRYENTHAHNFCSSRPNYTDVSFVKVLALVAQIERERKKGGRKEGLFYYQTAAQQHWVGRPSNVAQDTFVFTPLKECEHVRHRPPPSEWLDLRRVLNLSWMC